MRISKLIVFFVLISLFCLLVSADKRPARRSMKELTDPNSPSYVPYPYPKKRAEIIADIKYYCESVSGVGKESFAKGYVPVTDAIFENLFGPAPDYEFGRIIKVMNRIDELPDNYSWLAMIKDRNGNIVMRVAILASGLMVGSGAVGEEDLQKADPVTRRRFERFMTSKKDDDIKTILSESLGRAIKSTEIKKIERVAYSSAMGNLLMPLWEIKMNAGSTYYYLIQEDKIFSIDKKIGWKKGKKKRRPPKLSLVPHRRYLPDTENDELVILKEMPRKK